MQYEIMCKQTVDKNFCDCETDNLQQVNAKAVDDVLTEIYVTKYITKEVDRDGALNIEDESNQLAFVTGLVVAFLIMGIVILIVCLVLRKRQKLG